MSNPDVQLLMKYTISVDLSPIAQQNARQFTELMKQTQAETTQILKDAIDERAQAQRTAAEIHQQDRLKQLGLLEDIQKQATELVELQQAEQARIIEEANRAREEAEKDSLRRLQEQHEKHLETAKEKAKELVDGYLTAANGLVTMADGLASLGLLADKDAEKLKEMAATMKSVVDVVEGGVDIYRGISSAVEAYRASVLAAAAAEGALNAARAKGVVSAASGAAASGAAGAAGLAGNAIPTALVGIGAALTSLPAAIAAALVGVVSAGAMITNIGGSRDRAAAAIDSVKDTAWGWTVDVMNQGLGFGSAVSEYLGSAANPVGWGADQFFGGPSTAQLQRDSKASAVKTDRMAAERVARYDMFDRQNFTAQDKFDREQHLTNMRFARMASTGVDPQEQLSHAMSVLKTARQGTVRADAMQPGMMREAETGRAAQAEIEAMTRVIDLRKQSLAVSQQESRERLTGVQEETRELEHQLDVIKKQKETADERLKTAKERFGAMDEATQRKTITAKQKADSLGVNALTRDERALLRGMGTTAASEIASQGDIAAAEAAGFDKYFGGVERYESSVLASTQAQLEAKINVQREIKIKIEDDIEALTDSVTSIFTAEMEQRDKKIEAMMDRKISERQTQRNRQPPPGSTSVGS